MIQSLMELNRVVIVYKKTLHKLHRNSQHACRCARAPITSSMRYTEALDRIAATLEGMHIRTRFVDRRRLKPADDVDLVISVGGDGSVLAAAHAAGEAPVLGVNFMPRTSVGFFCAADITTFDRAIRRIIDDSLKIKYLPLLAVQIEGRKLKTMALNDVLFSSPSPAEMSRYTLHIGRKSEAQRSSGVWVAAGPGSTAAILSAGGKRQPMGSAKLQYLVREPCPLPDQRYRLIHGILPEGQTISIQSNMSNAFAYVDGPDLMYPIPRDARLTVRAVPKALKIFL